MATVIAAHRRRERRIDGLAATEKDTPLEFGDGPLACGGGEFFKGEHERQIARALDDGAAYPKWARLLPPCFPNRSRDVRGRDAHC